MPSRLVLSKGETKEKNTMYRRIITSLTVVLVGLAVAVPVATARYSQQALIRQQLGEIGGWAVPATRQNEPSLASERALVRERLQEIGAWAVPAPAQREPSLTSQRALVPERLGEIGAWAVPSTPTKTEAASSSGELNWHNLGIGTALAFGVFVLGVAGVVSMRRHHRPVIH
jgi:hypothetical protein